MAWPALFLLVFMIDGPYDSDVVPWQESPCPWLWKVNMDAHASFVITINTLRPRQNGPRFPDDIFKCIFLN